MFGSNRTTILVLILLVLVALVLARKVVREPISFVPNDSQEQVITDAEPIVDAVAYLPIPPQQGERISYGAALRAFVGSTIQFDTACRARPATMTVEVRSQVLLDNQSTVERTITIGKRSYTIPVYDFAIVTMPRTGTFSVACDDFNDVAVIGVE